jgi:UDP-glucose 4-epimerase
LRISLANPKVKFFVGDVRNSDSILSVMQDVNYVFHATTFSSLAQQTISRY